MAVHSKQNSSSSVGNYVANETPNGSINSINKDFELAYTPLLNSVMIALNGQIQLQGSSGDYVISGKNITFAKAPRIHSEILAFYFR